ncbi:hypothetical protein EMIHUDRAFT_222174 [Emiliania huxleyi CCMP1516]|uniref:Methyltransferase FkbM domain-containing protein n=2 Tax=Emiliania huxleyi TaxID=2903 RepID=A0A0D3KYJ4_EMIH1|nr:hypothetical protein EMIHUDRAFT_222174 [Emiliania huxleyi CCMP1516]EOD40829.1 hypothetical protein EMIHUDRAFT_222174 [Emiliania huxleyi CCMP1516]|eukprot:XP_005793258.1 hypothetical protein EMIHUDRAFT_222174 [Emiliania huxleyi CCMP1516]
MFHCNGDELPPSRPAAVETRAVWERHAPASEPIANSLLASLLLEDLVPEGGILDVGAFDGVFANFYAELMPHRTIYAIDPSMENIKKMRLPKQARSLPQQSSSTAGRSGCPPAPQARNLCSLWGAVGEADEAAQVNLTDAEANGSQPVRDRGHLDLEGHELPTLSGARQLLQRDKPLLSYEVAEIAGMTADVRNVLAVPASRLRAFTSSPALTAAYLGNTALAKSTLSQLPPSDAQALLPVHKWIGSVVAQGGADLTFFTRRRWYDQGWKPQLRDRRERTNHVWQIRRPLNMSGMTNDQDVPRAFDVEAETTTGSAFTRAVRESKPRKVKSS